MRVERWMSDGTEGQKPRRAHDSDEEEEQAEYQLAPPTGKSREEMMVSEVRPDLLRLATAPPRPAEPKAPMRFQFSLGQMMAMTTFASMGLAGACWMPSNLFLFFCGGVILALVGFSWKHNSDDPVARLVLWGSVTMYVAAIVACHFTS